MAKTDTYTLITGAAGGIGREFAEVFAANGHNLILTSRSSDRLLKLKGALEKRYEIKIVAVPADLIKHGAAKRLHLLTAGLEVDNLVNNAGFGDCGAFLDSSWEKQKEMITLNMSVLSELSYLYGRDMREAHAGHIMNVASAAAFCPGPYMAVYYASKSFVLSFSEALGTELKGSGVTVTALCPGPTTSGFEAAANLKGARMFKVIKPADARSVALFGYSAMQKGKPVALHGKAKGIARAARIAPKGMVKKAAAFINKKK